MVNGEQATQPFVHVLLCDSCLFESLWQGGAARVSAGTLLPKHAHMLTHACARYEPAMLATDAAVTAGLEAGGLAVHSFNTLLLREPGAVQVDMARYNGHFGTLMPFVRRAAMPP